jgi:hypothetical protein
VAIGLAIRSLSRSRPGYCASGACAGQERLFTCYALPTLTEEAAVAVKQVRVSDLSGRQADEDQFAKLIVHEHPQYQGPITLDVLPESDQYVSIEVIASGERSGQRALLRWKGLISWPQAATCRPS